ncbi:MAG TPA: universal stress protein [Candidatus Limnocylindrales bacterium]|nr:universal stress protein [Candidatus Limnocylindrales bacterium]
MYKKILVALDGSPSAEKVLPYARALAKRMALAVDLLEVVDIVEMTRSVPAAEGLFINQLAEDDARRSGAYLDAVARNFGGVPVHCSVKYGHAADIIIETAASDKDTLIAMATHGRSGVNRFLLGSVAEKVLRGTSNPLLLVRATEAARSDGEAVLKSVIVPLDGSELAESILPVVEELAKKFQLEVILIRAYAIPYGAYTAGEGFYDPVNLEAFLKRLREETIDYLEGKTAQLKRKGLADVSYVARDGLSADEIIKFARATPDTLIAMCSHGYSGVKRWVLGSVTETVVRHAVDPVLVLRAGN